jgi:hypothetical protein
MSKVYNLNKLTPEKFIEIFYNSTKEKSNVEKAINVHLILKKN